MAAHTRGPWQFEGPQYYEGRDAFTVFVGDEATPYRRVADVPAQEATGEDSNGEPVFGIDEANARLIAAAPELLEAAKDLLDVMFDRDGRSYDPATKARDEARLRDAVLGMAAAVDKAEGRE